MQGNPEKRPSRDFLVAIARRVSRDPQKEELPSIESMTKDSFGRTPGRPKALDIADPDPETAPPIRGMRPRNELFYDTGKEVARGYRRVVYDFDYWRNMRSTSRLFFALFNIPSSRILASVGYPTAFITAIAYACTLDLEIPDALLPLPTWTHFFPYQISPQPLILISSILSLLIIFRTNNSASRFDEARKMWGLMLNRSRDLVREALSFFPPTAVDESATLARWTMAFTVTLKCHLRPNEDLRGKVERFLTPGELELLMSADHKVPP